MFRPRPPPKVLKKIRALGCTEVEWEFYDDDKWFGYTTFGGQPVAITVSLVTGKALIEILAPLVYEEVLT